MNRLWVLLLAASIAPCTQAAYFVDAANDSGNEDGLSWATAFTTIQEGIDAADVAGDDEVRVAASTYNILSPPIMMKAGVSVFGGYPSGGGLPESRDPSLYPTYVRGDTQGVIGNTGVFDGFVILFTTGSNGAGFYCGTGETTIRNCVFRYNEATNGGGVFIDDNVTTRIEDCRFLHNRATNKGAGIYAGAGARVTILRSTFQYNVSSSFGGGAFFETNGAESILIEDCHFDDNRATTSGGGLFAVNGDLTVRATSFAANWSRDGGAIFHSTDQAPLIDGCEFVGNEATEGSVVAVTAPGLSTSVQIFDSTFAGNRSAEAPVECSSIGLDVRDSVFRGNHGDVAGAIWVVGSGIESLTIDRSEFTHNVIPRSASAFGTVYGLDVSTAAVRNSIFANNATSVAVFINGQGNEVQGVDVIGCTFVQNDVGGLRVDNVSNSDSPTNVINSIFYGHAGASPIATMPSNLPLLVVYCIVPNSAEYGATNIETDPLFFDASHGDYRLTTNSPARDAGVASLADIDIPAEDVTGRARPIGGAFDIGAHEYDPVTNTDQDALPDALEPLRDTDGNGLPEWLDPATDPLSIGDVNRDGETNAVDIQLVINDALGVL